MRNLDQPMNQLQPVNLPYTVRYEPEVPGLFVRLDERITSEELHACLERLFELLQQYQVSKILWDISQLQPIPLNDQHWIRQWTERAVQAGYRTAAGVMSVNAVMQLTNEQFAAHARSLGITVQAFMNPEEARAWLKDAQ